MPSVLVAKQLRERDCVLDERLRWNAFKRKTRDNDPLGRKLDHRYYKRMRKSYKAQTEKTSPLDPWLARNGVELQVTSERCTEDHQHDAIRRDP